MPVISLTSEERIGTEIGGRYKIKKLIGEGAFGAVFLAEHTLTSREVALKLLHAHLVQAEQMAQRFLREAQAMAKLRHPAIVEVLDAGKEADGTLFLALELLVGETLEDQLVREGKLGLRESVQIVERILSALSVAHQASIIHRDIKPANIFLAKDPEGEIKPKLLDFGIAAVTSGSQSREGKLTNAGMILGTPEYMAPEQGRSSKVGPPADLWSIGIVLYELVSGVVPWSSDSATAVLLSVASDPLPSILEFAPDLPPTVVAVIEKVLQKNPEQRFQSASEMRTALLQAAEAAGAYQRPTTAPGAGSGLYNVQALLAAQQAGGTSDSSPNVPANIKRRGQEDIDFSDAGSSSLAIQLDAPMASNTGRFQTPGAVGRVRAPMPDSMLGGEPDADALGGTLLQSADGLAADALDMPDLPMPDMSAPPVPAAAPLVSGAQRMRADSMGGGSAPRAVTGANHGAAQAAAQAAIRTTGSHGAAARSAATQAPTGAGLMPSPVAITFNTGKDGKSSATATDASGGGQKRSPAVFVAVPLVLALVGGAVYMATRGPTTTVPTNGSATAEPTGAPTADDPTARDAPPTRRFGERMTIGLPFEVTAGPASQSFGKHLTVGPLVGGQRVISTCALGTAHSFSAGTGAPLGSAPLGLACDGYDLLGIPDLDNDGQTDLAALPRARDGIAVIVGRSPSRVLRTIPLPRVAGIVGLLDLRGAPTLVTYVEGATPAASSEVVAVNIADGRVVWRIAGQAPFVRVGHPTELGLSVGPDANGDGVGDVAVGLSVPANMPSEQVPSRPRCVQIFSGVDGAAVWREPFCQLRGGGQSVSLGPDVDGDNKADLAVGTDVSRGGDGRVVLVSGANARVLRRINAPSSPSGQGFGWPVVLGADISGDQHPDLLVGSVSSAGTFVNALSSVDGSRLAEYTVRGASGYPNLRIVVADGLMRGSGPMVAVGSPEDGLHVLGID